MDSLTHIALGAASGEILLGKKLGKKALVIGALANSFPDIDFVAALWLSPADNVLAHRGFTHSFLFMGMFTVLFALMAMKLDNNKLVSKKGWLTFMGIQLGLHVLVDAFNAYGVGWLIPFYDWRISFHTIFVVDPFYSTVLILAFLLLLALPVLSPNRTKVAAAGLFLSSFYLVYALGNKLWVEQEVKELLAKQEITYHRHFTTPTPLNTWLWFVVAEVDSGYQVGYRSVFDKADSLSLTYFPRNEMLLHDWRDNHDVKQLKKFSQGFYTVEHYGDTLVFNDLRFGQITGWQDPTAPFVFHYYVNHPDQNLLVMQRGRFANWNEKTVNALLTRIRGETPYSR